MDFANVKSALEECVSNPKTLASGDSFLKSFIGKEGFFLHTATIVTQEGLAAFQVRSFAGVILKNFANDYWHTEFISPLEKQQTKELLLTSYAAITNYTLKNAVARVLAVLAFHEFPNVWEGFLETVAENLGSGEVDVVDASLRVVIFTIERCDDRFHVFLPQLLSSSSARSHSRRPRPKSAKSHSTHTTSRCEPSHGQTDWTTS